MRTSPENTNPVLRMCNSNECGPGGLFGLTGAKSLEGAKKKPWVRILHSSRCIKLRTMRPAYGDTANDTAILHYHARLEA